MNQKQTRVGIYGEYHHTLDEKNRLFIPARLREIFKKEGKLVLSRGLDRCLFLFPHSEWQSLEDKAKSLPITDRDARDFTRYLFSGVSVTSVDAQGRIPLPSHLKSYAQINKNVVIIGVSTRAEIWAEERWERYLQQTEEKVDEIASKLEEFGI